jgi:LAO/AO transport system kinase
MRTCADYASALRLMRKRTQDPPRETHDFPKALAVSALQEDGIFAAWSEIQTLAAWRKDNGIWDARRARQARFWFKEEVRAGLLSKLTSDKAVKAQLAALEDHVAHGRIPPTQAAELMIAKLFPPASAKQTDPPA